ncbi:GNAT family N-acetyltransferase [Belliella marina]|uniref:GNAT family N-acetyltransferase n=1 Tax=Belliella marina TaxID=1644146 RepID=A0ABW4VPN4_9BACT
MDFRAAKLEDIPGIVSLLRLSLGEKLLPKSEAFWVWKHIDNPFGASLVLLAIDKGDIVGVRAFMRWEWVYQGKVLKALRAVDTAVHPDYQGQGLFTRLTKKLLEDAKNEGFDFIFNTPNSKSIQGYYKMGWEKFGSIPINVQFNGLFVKKSTQVMPNIDVELFLKTIDRIKMDSEGISKKCNVEFLEWRYLKCPLHTYHFSTDGETYLLIYRFRETSFGTEMRIVEMISLKKIDRQGLRLVNEEIKRIQTQVKVNYTTNISSGHGFLLGGIFSLPKLPIGPILTIRDLNLGRLRHGIFDKSNWDYSLGDLELF